MNKKPKPPRHVINRTTVLDFDEEIKFLEELDAHTERKCDPKKCIFCMPRKEK